MTPEQANELQTPLRRMLTAARARPWGWVAAGVVLVAAMMSLRSIRRTGHGPERPHTLQSAIAVDPSPSERALLSPLAVGSALGPGVITRLNGIQDGGLSVQLRVGGAPVEILIKRRAGSSVEAPVEAGPYALYYTTTTVPYAQVQAALRALGAVLSSHADMPVPSGLTPKTHG